MQDFTKLKENLARFVNKTGEFCRPHQIGCEVTENGFVALTFPRMTERNFKAVAEALFETVRDKVQLRCYIDRESGQMLLAAYPPEAVEVKKAKEEVLAMFSDAEKELHAGKDSSEVLVEVLETLHGKAKAKMEEYCNQPLADATLGTVPATELAALLVEASPKLPLANPLALRTRIGR